MEKDIDDVEEFQDKSIVGSLINFRGMVYSPINEQGVVLLFGKILKDLNMYIEEVKVGYPDCVARIRTRKGWEKLFIEFEYSSSGFKSHISDLKKGKKCDMVVCWVHDWKECPIRVLELREEIKNMPSEPFGEEEVKEEERYDLEHHFKRKNVTKSVQDIFLQIDKKILDINEEIFRKYAKTAITYYSPEKNFVYLRFRKNHMILHIYTKQKKITGVKNIKSHENWGELKIQNKKDLRIAINAIKKSYGLMKKAIKENINTGWYAVTPKESMSWLKNGSGVIEIEHTQSR